MAKSSEESSGPDSSTDLHGWGWTRTHRIGIAVILALTLVFLSISYFRNPYRLDDPVVVVNGQPVVLKQQVDPNTADWPSLARLPHIGEAMAKRLVAYRQENIGINADGIVFHHLDDLEKVAGFGPKTCETLRPYLVFPDEPGPATTPSDGHVN